MKQQNKKMTLYKLRMKHRRARRVDVEQLRQDTDAYLAENTPSKNEIDILADTWAFVAENIEREEWKTYTREDWEELERQHVERAYYTKPDLLTIYLRSMNVDCLRQMRRRHMRSVTGNASIVFARTYLSRRGRINGIVRKARVEAWRPTRRYDLKRQERICPHTLIRIFERIRVKKTTRNMRLRSIWKKARECLPGSNIKKSAEESVIGHEKI
ncbi:hypothetical protein [Paracerasibacillus soli]|uniref:Uncharacterized protein n=1 Tax=Paracerasibacillus soli TaxID=480284 RepID=A0ABU5CUC0_9BACI|nr:hypothetical protein [Virgibacillus soli]MDY0409959.1 hypothetical protein [Virgibacillus soli]